jgi:hypothetical protein
MNKTGKRTIETSCITKKIAELQSQITEDTSI